MAAPFRIAEPGIYLDMKATDYYGDPCPSPSLTQSLAKVLIDRSPRHAWWQHPRLNPAYAADNGTRFDLAHIAHLYLTGRGRDVEIVDADDWRTKAAQAARESALAAGKIAILAHQGERAIEMIQATRDQLGRMGLHEAFHVGDGEVVLAWREDDTWFRSMVDWLSPDRLTIWDLKTTEASAAPHALGAKMASDGWALQASMHERGLNALHPDGAGRRKHRFVCIECEPPYALTVTELTESALTVGRKQLAYAIDTWRACIASGTWPGYPPDVQRPDYPGWAESRWLERELEEEERRVRAPMLTELAGG